MRLNTMRHVLFAIVLLFSLPIVYAGCGDGSATGAEQCDGDDLRGYVCQTVHYMNPGNPSDYANDAVSYPGSDRFYMYDAGGLRCTNVCRIDVSLCYSHICGNAVVTGSEECDDGAANSDTQRDSCRSDCVLPSCGDGVADTGEQCDDGTRNSDDIPGACRSDCTLASCGDGVIDSSVGEECDDQGSTCFKCRRCREPVDNLDITVDTVLCPGHYQIADEDVEGVIRVRDSVTLRCDNTRLYGVPTSILPQAASASAHNGVLPGAQDPPSEQESAGPFGRVVRFFKNMLSANTPPPSNPVGNLGVNSIAEIKHGTGILVLGDDSVVIGCEVANYRTGIEVRGDSAVVRNIVCGNNRDLVGDGLGLANTCNGYNWSDDGYVECSHHCDGDAGTPGAPACSQSSGVSPPPEEVAPTQSASQKIVCGDGSKADSLADCQKPRFKCKNGDVVYSYEECPACSRGKIMCDDGACVDEQWMCDPYVCDDGTNVESSSDCSEYCAGYTCDDGRCVEERWLCNPSTCADGSLVASKEDCADYCAGYRCDDGSCVKSGSDCVICCKTQSPTVTARVYQYAKMSVSACRIAKGVEAIGQCK